MWGVQCRTHVGQMHFTNACPHKYLSSTGQYLNISIIWSSRKTSLPSPVFKISLHVVFAIYKVYKWSNVSGMFWQNKHGVQRQHCLIIHHPIWPHLIKMQRNRWPAFFHDAVVEYYSRVFVSNCTLHITSMALHHSGLAPANYALEMSHLVQIKAEVVKLFGKNNHIFRGAFDFETSTWKLELLYVYRFETRQPLPIPW